MSNTFTFKKQPKETGLRGVAAPWQSTDIKHNKQIVGIIAAPTWQDEDRKWTVRFMVERPKHEIDPCTWKWVTLTRRFGDEQLARKWIKENTEQLLRTLRLHYMEAD